MRTAWTAFLLCLAILTAFVAYLAWPRGGDTPNEPLRIYCAAGIRPPVEEVARAYQQECGGSVEILPGPSEALLAQAEASQSGDLYLPADESFIRKGRERKQLQEVLPLASM